MKNQSAINTNSLSQIASYLTVNNYLKNGLSKFKISHVRPNMSNFFAGTNLSKKTLMTSIDKIRNTQNAKSITDSKDFDLNN